ARDAAIALLRDRIASGAAVRGGEADDASRQVIVDRGFGQYFTHRTGHSIDESGLHGSGAHLDNLETREERVLLDGCGFSIEPGIYIAGEIGMRTEVNAYVSGQTLVITPSEPQVDLLIV
ncbi:MAG: M24 family metallopeptidase, partial [Gemmatimonadota bacterium]|nr:M24 family metallopeptidase [Gemmatimonadota bacterium]